MTPPVDLWTVAIQDVNGNWSEFAHDAPLSLAYAEERLTSHQTDNPDAILRVQPWFSLEQSQFLAKLVQHAFKRGETVGRASGKEIGLREGYDRGVSEYRPGRNDMGG